MGDTVLLSQGSRRQIGWEPHGPTAIPAIGYCAEKNRLMREFLEAIHQIGELQSQQARALIEGDPDFSRFDALIHMANEKKAAVKYAWLSHVEQHHC